MTPCLGAKSIVYRNLLILCLMISKTKNKKVDEFACCRYATISNLENQYGWSVAKSTSWWWVFASPRDNRWRRGCPNSIRYERMHQIFNLFKSYSRMPLGDILDWKDDPRLMVSPVDGKLWERSGQLSPFFDSRLSWPLQDASKHRSHVLGR